MSTSSVPDTRAAVDQFRTEGLALLGPAVDPARCAALLNAMLDTRPFGPALFLTADEFEAAPQRRGVNPRPGRPNLVDRFDLSFITDAPLVKAVLKDVCGPAHNTLLAKAVCGVPRSWLPPYVLAEIENVPAAMLGPYIRPEFRDVTYFHGIDYHQDLVDYPGRPADFITLYVYLAEVTPHDSPLFVLPGSHTLGATVFPHRLERDASRPGTWRYGDGRGHDISVDERMLTGQGGSAALWHACTLHGTQPVAESRPRISIRYIIEKDPAVRCVLDEVNEKMAGPLMLDTTRVDQDADARTIVRGNNINAGSV